MILTQEEWPYGYSQIIKDCRSSDLPVLLVVSATSVDAVCASRMWAYWLRADGVSYELLAADQWSTVQCRLLSTEYGACVLFNLGATANLPKLLAGVSCRVFVTDAQRPVHLANVYAPGENVVLFWDPACGEPQDLPSDGDNLSGKESSSDEEEDDEEDDDEDEEEDDLDNDDNEDEGEHEFGQDEKANGVDHALEDDDYDGEDEMDGTMEKKQQKRRRRSAASGDDPLNTTAATIDTALSDDDTSSIPDDTQATAASATLASTADNNTLANTMPALTPRELYRERRQRLRQYYASGTSYGSPASYLAWELATSSRFGTQPDLLWLAMTGVSGSYLYHQLDRTGYLTLALPLREACERLFPNDLYTRMAHQTVYAEHLMTNNAQRTETRTKINVSDNGRILSETDFRFFLLRHTNLYQSIMHSDYVATKLQLTTAAGRLKLQEWLATMGFALQDAQQPFALMKPSLRRKLQERVRQTAPDYGLDELECTSFFRVTGFQSLLSAADTAHAVAALLCAQDNCQTAFQWAFDALNCQDTNNSHSNMNTLVNGSLESQTATSGLAGGLRLASVLQQAIQTTAASLMDRRAITRLSHFRYAYITSSKDAVGGGGSQYQQWFCHPMVLVRLAHYLMDWHRASQQWTGPRARPLILCAQDARTDTYTIVGQVYPEHAGNLADNTLGQYFALAAKTLHGDTKNDSTTVESKEDEKKNVMVRLDGSFDTNVVQVAASHVQRFIEQLHYLMDSL